MPRGNRHKLKHWKFQLDMRENVFHYEGCQALEEAAQRGCGSPSIHSLTGHSPLPPGLRRRGWSRCPPEAPSSPSHSVVLCILPATRYGNHPEKYHCVVYFIYFPPKISKYKSQCRKHELMLQQCYYMPPACAVTY